MANKVDKAIQNLGSEEDGVFIRMSSRSPKDAVIDNQSLILPIIKEEFKNIDLDNVHEIEKALCYSLLKAQRIYSGKQAFDLLLYRSVRTRWDVENSLNYQDIWRNSIIVRKWVDIKIDMEFRGFVHNKELTALCQYSHDLYFPDLEEKIESIVPRIEEFFEQVKNIIPYDDFTIDFIVLDKVYIVELNPFDSYTGPALFNYKDEEDLNSLLKRPLTIRIKMEKDYKQAIANEWDDVITKVKKNDNSRKRDGERESK